jgi:hypothetical protein
MRRPGRLIGVCAGLCVFVALALRPLFSGETSPEIGQHWSATNDSSSLDSSPSTPPTPEVNTVEIRSVSPKASERTTDSREKTLPDSAAASPLAAPATAANRDSSGVKPTGGTAPTGGQETSPGQLGQTPPASTVGPTSPANASATIAVTDPNSETTPKETTTELVGFVVRGRSPWERLQIEDLDSLVTTEGKRWLPLLRVLRAFAVQIDEQTEVIRFAPEGVGDIALDLGKRQVSIRGQTSPIEFVERVSEITMKPDFYISPEDLSKILDIELQWDSGMYEYRIQLDRKLSIWKLGSSKSLLSRQTKYVEMDLPEALPPADRSRASLQFVEFDWHPSYTWQRTGTGASGASPVDSHALNVSGPRETIWGNAYNGQYKVQVSQSSLQWTNHKGWGWENNDNPYLAQVDWFEWVQRFRTSEVTVGDSTFGLSDLVYPVFTATGVRINGLLGWTPDELVSDKSRMGLQQYFGKPQVFQGTAPIGAEVELLLNGRTLDVQKVFPQADSPPGMGVYRFEGIELPNGILNEVTVVIKESNGNEIRVEKSVMGTPQMVPQGHAAYLGILGTKRERREIDKQVVDPGNFYGYITGGRVLYGLTDRLTVGTVLASEDDHYHRLLENRQFALSTRPYPTQSQHAGGTVSYLPLDNLMLSGDMAASQGEGQDRYNDMAARMRAEYLPTQKLSLSSDLLNLGPHYFDGSDVEVSDRRGGEMGFSWKLHKSWSLEGGMGEIRNNVDGQLPETTLVDYQSLGAVTTVLPRTSVTTRLYHLNVSTEEETRFLTELGFRTTPAPHWSLFGQVFLGKELTVQGDDRFLTLLRLRYAPRHLRPAQYWALRRDLNRSNAISLIYDDAEVERSLSLVHDLNTDIRNHPLRLHTEFIRELREAPDGHDYGFRGRYEYLLDRVGYNSLGAMAEYRHGAYTFLLYLNMTNFYSRHDGRFTNVNESRVRTSYGAIQGKVFVDYNGNHHPDPNEPGVPKVKVCLGETTSTVTDKDGYYILPAPANTSEVRVYLDVTTVPAIYSVTHGTQLAKIYRDSLTEVNLSVSPLISVVGQIVAVEPNAVHTKTSDPNAAELRAAILEVADSNSVKKPVSGVRVYVSDPQSNRLVTDSVTGDDGAYYFGDVKPGQYLLRVDPKTLAKQYKLVEPERMIEVKPTREEFIEIRLPDLIVAVQSESKTSGQSPTEGKNEEDLKADPGQKH